VWVSHEIRVLSLYEGFFRGGARILHTDVLTGLHGRGQHHRVLSIHGQVYREATFQWMQDDPCYRRLVASGVPVAALRDGGERATMSADAVFDERELSVARQEAALADVVLTLKEQPLRLVNQAALPGPVITCLHRSDPENQGPALEQLHAAVAAGRIAALICCAESTRIAYRDAGIPASLLHVIPNGVDPRRFRPDPRARGRLRASLGIAADAPVIAFAARYDAMKDVPLFLASAAKFLARHADAHVLMCGTGMTADNPKLLDDLRTAGFDSPNRTAGFAGPNAPGAEDSRLSRIHLLGPREDPEVVYAASDVVALTSAFGEAAPLCLIEGMMCGAVPVATNVGDCAPIVAGRGLLTPHEAEAVADAWTEAVARRAEFAPALFAARTAFGRRRMISRYASLIRRTSGISARRLPAPLADVLEAVA
jgi:glycosyltransferase involved in cell wall biosynthesis